MLGTAIPGHFWAIFVKNVNREMGQICNICFWPLFTIQLGKNAKNGKICSGKRAHRDKYIYIYIYLSLSLANYVTSKITFDLRVKIKYSHYVRIN